MVNIQNKQQARNGIPFYYANFLPKGKNQSLPYFYVTC